MGDFGQMRLPTHGLDLSATIAAGTSATAFAKSSDPGIFSGQMAQVRL